MIIYPNERTQVLKSPPLDVLLEKVLRDLDVRTSRSWTPGRGPMWKLEDEMYYRRPASVVDWAWDSTEAKYYCGFALRLVKRLQERVPEVRLLVYTNYFYLYLQKEIS